MSSDVSIEVSNVARVVRAPKAAAFAGVVFSVLFSAGLLLVKWAVPASPDDAGQWLADESKRELVLFALGLSSFAGIAFLWFVGVIRNRLGDAEDKFFASAFLGSGLLFVAMVFAASAIAAGMVSSAGTHQDGLVSSGAWEAGRRTVDELINVYGMRMAAVFSLATSTLLVRSRLAPRLLIMAGYLVALLLLVGGGLIPLVALLFPAWVLALSIYVLIASEGAAS